MRRLDIPFEFLRQEPESFSAVFSELLDGFASAHAEFGEMFGGQSTLPEVPGYLLYDEAGILDSENWLEGINDVPPEQQQEVLAKMPVYRYVVAFWEYAVDTRWSSVLEDMPRLVFHHVASFCALARYATEEMSIGSIIVPINIERLYARARARLYIDISREPGCMNDDDPAFDGYDLLAIEEVALLGEVAPQSVRNALNAVGSARLPSRRYEGEIRIDPADAHQWLLGRKRYVATDLSTVTNKAGTGRQS